MLRRAGQPVVLAEIVQRAAQLVGAGLGDHVHEARAGTAELGAGAARGHDDFLHRIQIERERRPLAAALLAEERIVEVGAVHRHVVLDAALTRHRQLVAVRALHDRHVGREQGEVQEIAAVVGETRHRLHRQRRGCLHARRIHRCLLRLHHHRRQLHRAELQRQVHRLAHPHRDARPGRLAEAERAGGDAVGAERQQEGDEHTALVALDGAFKVGLDVVHRHLRARDGSAGRVGHDAPDHAGGGLRLREQG